MKRHPALTGLSREHHASLKPARRCLQTADAGTPEAMAEMARRMGAGECRWLRPFGQWPRTHTRLEERRLFPLVEQHFTPPPLERVEALT